MGLTDFEKSVLTELLSGVSEGDLMQIAKTVSQKMLNVNTVNRALEVILLHSQTIESVLHRKKISKQLLFNYLHYKQIPVQPHLSKDEIIQRLLHYWKENCLTWERTGQSHLTNHEESSSYKPGDQYIEDFSSSAESSYHNYTNSEQSSDYKYSENYQSSLVPQSHEIVPQVQHDMSQYQAIVPQSTDICQTSSSNQLVSNINVQELGIEFTKWFNDRFNSCDCANGYLFDASMFFANANAEFKIVRSVNGEETVENSSMVESSELIGTAIMQLQKAYNLFLNTNLESLKVTRNSYGNILIGVCGSLHSSSQLAGVYEQLFQLFHDPLCTLSDQPVWKIQKTLLNVKFVNSYREIESSNSSGDMLGIAYGQLNS